MAPASPTEESTLQALVQYNEERLATFRNHPIFALVEAEDVLASDAKRGTLLSCIQRFSSNFQTLILLRQGLCIEPRFARMFRQHLSEEIGHDELLKSGQQQWFPVCDTVFEAILGWLNYQMIVLDDMGRAVLMHLVLEAAGDLFHGHAAERLGRYVNSGYFEVHSELDEGHAKMGVELLAGETSRTYGRLREIIRLGWDMLEAINDRVVALVNAA